MSYTKNEIALETFISNTNNQFYYIGEEDDKVAPIDVKNLLNIVLPLLIHWRLKNELRQRTLLCTSHFP